MKGSGARARWMPFAWLGSLLFVCWSAAASAVADEASIEARLDSLAAEVRALKQAPAAATKVKLNGLVQARWETSETSADSVRASGGTVATANRNRFVIRRARLKAAYEEPGFARGVFYVTAGETRGVDLLEAYVSLFDPWTPGRHTLSLGQMNVPFGFDLEHSASRQELLERSTAERTLFPGERDRGVTLESRWSDRVATSVGVFNGTTIGEDARFYSADPNGNKALVGRVRVSFGAVTAAVSGYGATNVVPLAGPDAEHDETRLGFDAQAAYRIAAGKGGVRVEWFAGHNTNADSVAALTTTSGGAVVPVPGADLAHLGTDFQGGYATWFQDFATHYQAAARWDLYDPNVDVEHDQAQRISLALHGRYGANVRASVLYEIPITDRAVPAGGHEDPPDNRWTIQFQHAF